MDIRGLFLLVLSLAATAMGQSRMTGGYEPIKDLKDPHIVDIAEFAVSKYNADRGTNLKYIEVIKGESQVVDGVNYRLTISADDGTNANALHNYLAVIHEDPSNQGLTLMSFHTLLGVKH